MKKSNIIMLIIMLACAPLLHIQFAKGMRATFGIVELMSPTFRGMGTGFHITAPNGKRYIMTNAHVCRLNHEGKLLSIVKNNINEVKVLYIDTAKDLCLVEPSLDIPGVESYAQGRELLPVITSGYGGGNSITSTIGFKKSEHLIPLCVESRPFIGCVAADLFVSDEYDFVVIGGHSGSPIVSPFGELVGVIFAGNGVTSFAVPHSLIMSFLDDADKALQ